MSGFIGLVGGMSWESTALYYRRLNQETQRRRGGHRNGRSLVESLEFQSLLDLANAGSWDAAADSVVAAARRLAGAGVDLIALTSVTGHRFAGAVREAVPVPFVHVADAVAAQARSRGWRSLALLGTRYTLEQAFFRSVLEDGHGIEVRLPCPRDRERLHHLIVEDLSLSRFEPDSREWCLDLARHLVAQGADGMVLACTELPLLLPADTLNLPCIDAVDAHVHAIVDRLEAAGPDRERAG